MSEYICTHLEFGPMAEKLQERTNYMMGNKRNSK